MARVITRKYQNNNMESKAYGKFYGRVVHTETLSTEQFAKHIADHGSPFDRSIIIGVLAKACDCLVELVKDSKCVRLGDLGTFYLSAESEGAVSEEKYTADNVKRLHLRFLPNRKKSYPLDSGSLRKQATLKDIDDLLGNKKSDGDNDGGDGE